MKQQTLAIVANTACLGLTLWAPGGDGAAQEKKRMAKEQRAKEAAKAIELGELPPPKKIPKVRARYRPAVSGSLLARNRPSIHLHGALCCHSTPVASHWVCAMVCVRRCALAATLRHGGTAWQPGTRD